MQQGRWFIIKKAFLFRWPTTKKRTPDANLAPSSIHLEEASVTHQSWSKYNCSPKRSAKSSFEKSFSRNLSLGLDWLSMESTSAQVRHSIYGSPIFHRIGQIRPCFWSYGNFVLPSWIREEKSREMYILLMAHKSSLILFQRQLHLLALNTDPSVPLSSHFW